MTWGKCNSFHIIHLFFIISKILSAIFNLYPFIIVFFPFLSNSHTLFLSELIPDITFAITKLIRFFLSKFVASFIGFAPADNPKIALALVIDEPHPYFGGVVCAPAFKNICVNVLRYLEEYETEDLN